MRFPVLLCYAGCDELQLVQNVSELAALKHGLIIGQDYVIDSEGVRYNVSSEHDFLSDEKVALNVFQTLVQHHALAQSQCCISKIRLNEFDDGFRFVESLSGSE